MSKDNPFESDPTAAVNGFLSDLNYLRGLFTPNGLVETTRDAYDLHARATSADALEVLGMIVRVHRNVTWLRENEPHPSEHGIATQQATPEATTRA